MAILIGAYLGLTIWYGYLGYLDDPGRRIRGHDSVYYYTYVRSLWFDGDLDFQNEWAHFYGASENRPSQENVFSVGPAIAWTPLFALGHAATLVARSLGSEVAADGYSWYYQAFVYVGNSLYGLLGILLTGLFIRRFTEFPSVLLALLATLLATQITYYLWSFSAMSHNVSFAATALFLHLWSRSGPSKRTGLAGAAMCLARWQNALFLVLPLVSLGKELAPGLRDRGRPLRLSLSGYAGFCGVLLCGLTLQFAAWQVMFGKPMLIPQGAGFLNLGDLHLADVLFSLRHGLFAWHPLLLVGFAGCALLWRTDRTLTVSLGLVFLLQWVLNAAVADWWAGWSFGHRRFISLLPVFALGLALIADRMRGRLLAASIGIVLVAAVWNQLFLFQYVRGLIPRGGSPTVREMIWDKFGVRRIDAAQKAVNSGLLALDRGDVEGFARYATLAYSIHPDYRNSLLLYGLKCLASGDESGTLDVFQRWHRQRPDDVLAGQGLAAAYARRGELDMARSLYAPGAAIGDSTAQALGALDEGFFQMYRRRLRNVHAE